MMYVQTYTHTHTHTYIHIHTDTHTHTHTQTHTHARSRTNTNNWTSPCFVGSEDHATGNRAVHMVQQHSLNEAVVGCKGEHQEYVRILRSYLYTP